MIGRPLIDFVGYHRIVRVPPGITTKDELLARLAGELAFPEHFGRNWDALSDCLRDLSWMPGDRVLLVHEDLPLADDPEEAAAYVDILLDAEEDWRSRDGSRFVIVFPERLRRKIAGLDARAR